MKFVAIRDVNDQKEVVADIFKSLIGVNISVQEDGDLIIIKHSYDNDSDICDTLAALETGLYISVRAYMSQDSSEDRLASELEIYKSLKDELPRGIYNLKTALLNANRIPNKHLVFDYIISSSGVNEEIIHGIVNADLNVSSAAKELNFHRNTMNYKVAKLKELSGFDLKSFKDVYIIYMLIDKK